MKFNPSDFTDPVLPTGMADYDSVMISAQEAAMFANDKLAAWLKDAKVVYIQEHETGSHVSYMPRDKGFSDNYKALLICVEPIEQCRHEASKVLRVPDNTWECACGARVKPSGFEVVTE